MNCIWLISAVCKCLIYLQTYDDQHLNFYSCILSAIFIALGIISQVAHAKALRSFLCNLDVLYVSYLDICGKKNMKSIQSKDLLLPLLMSGGQTDIEHDEQLLEEVSKPKPKAPSMFDVVMLNDDFTPMEFVVEVLETFFSLDREAATRVMLTVHTAGKAVCGTYTRDIAETKALQVNQLAQENQHPLLCEIEALSD